MRNRQFLRVHGRVFGNNGVMEAFGPSEHEMPAMDETTLRDLIARAQAKDADAFDALVDHFGPRLFGYLARLTGSRDQAEDLVQEVFLRVVRKIEGYRHEDLFEAWLFRIATNLVRDRIRRQKRTPSIASIDGESEGVIDAVSFAGRSDNGSPDRAVELREEADRMQAALEQLPDAEREVVMMRHYSQLSFATIAEIMKTPLGTALARSHRGLAKLRALMES